MGYHTKIHFCPILISILSLFLFPYSNSAGGWQPVIHSGESYAPKSGLPLHTSVSYHGNYPPISDSHGFGPSSSPLLLGSDLGSEGLGESPASLGHDDQCSLYKVGFVQDLYFQYIQYKHPMPELKEFTLCMWSKFTNHSNDHPLFSYAVDGQPRALLGWISNTDRSSYFSMSIHGHTFFRLNYPIRLNRWYHSCFSWNGKTGEWQLWVNAERVGRGFHNRLVGHKIPAGGIFITGQEQSQLGGGFQEGHNAPKGSGGMLGEITMFQLYKVALTAGKAHKDHKHHHAHKFLHEGVTTTSTTPRPINRPVLPQHPLLTAGQINTNFGFNFAGGQPNQQPTPQLVPSQFNGQPLNAQYQNGQFLGRLVSEQLISSQLNNGILPSGNGILPSGNGIGLPQNVGPSLPPEFRQNGPVTFISQNNPANIQYIDSANLGGHQLFKRNNKDKKEVTDDKKITLEDLERTKREEEQNTSTLKEHKLTKRNDPNKEPKRQAERTKRGDKKYTNQKELVADESKHSKRGIFLAGGTLFEDSQLANFDSPFLLNGLAGIGENEPVLQAQKASDEREPAEAEVKAVMAVCSGCAEEPFAKALVFGWRTVPKKLFSGAFYTPAVPECKYF